jgi:imidazolonepropionase-like amidohydrolase
VSAFTLRGARVLDEAGGFTSPVDIRITNGRIARVAADLPVDPDAPDQDFSGRYLLPGIFDVHVHAMTNSADAMELLRTPLTYRVAEALASLKRTLRAGVTSVRDAGGLDAGIRDALARGLAEGPRAQVSVVPLTQTGGHGDGFLAGPGWEMSNEYMTPDYPGRPVGVADGVDEVRRAVRQNIRAGADWIKLLATGGVMSAGDGQFDEQFSPEEIAVAVSEATRRGVPVMAHALGGPALRTAVEAGVRSIEHGLWLTEEDAALMAERGAYLVPTLTIYRQLADAAERGELPATVATRARAAGDVLGEAVRIAHAAGVPIALGSDFAHRDDHGNNLREIPLLHRAGLTPEQALLAATGNGARLCGVDGDVGRLVGGQRFDAVVLDQDPGDLSVFERPGGVSGVFQNGRPVQLGVQN